MRSSYTLRSTLIEEFARALKGDSFEIGEDPATDSMDFSAERYDPFDREKGPAHGFIECSKWAFSDQGLQGLEVLAFGDFSNGVRNEDNHIALERYRQDPLGFRVLQEGDTAAFHIESYQEFLCSLPDIGDLYTSQDWGFSPKKLVGVSKPEELALCTCLLTRLSSGRYAATMAQHQPWGTNVEERTRH